MVDTNTDFFEKKNNYIKYNNIKSNCIIKSDIKNISIVTVVIPTYNRSDTLIHCINSVLNQNNFTDFEILVIDNDNTKFNVTEQIIRSLNSNKITYYKNERNIGQIGNWNRGIQLAKSEWIVLLHDDDLLCADYLYTVFRVLGKNRKIQALGTKFDEYNIGKSSIKTSVNVLNHEANRFIFILVWVRNLLKFLFKDSISKLSLRDFHFECGYYAPIGTIYKRDNVINLGGFNENYYPISDWVFHVNYMLNYNLYILSSVITKRGIGINESLDKKIRIGFVEAGYYFRKAILKKRKSIFGEWWIQIASWYKAVVNYNLYENDFKTNILNTKYNNKYCRTVYLFIYRIYNLTKKY